MKAVLLALLILSIGFSTYAKTKSQWGRIAVDGSPVYKQPNFDAPIMDYLNLGKKVKMSAKIHKGIGGFGAFYKVRLSRGKYGYISDVEVTPTIKKKRQVTAPTNEQKDPWQQEFSQDSKKKEQDSSKMKMPIIMSKYIGVSLGMINVTETFEGIEFSSFQPSYGFKSSGVGFLIDGPPLDIELSIVSSTPSYYNKFSQETSGMSIRTHVALMLPLSDFGSGIIYYGLGPTIVYSRYTVNLAGSKLDSEYFNIGAVFPAGVAFRLGSFLLKVEAKYYWEKNKYIAMGLGLQRQF